MSQDLSVPGHEGDAIEKNETIASQKNADQNYSEILLHTH